MTLYACFLDWTDYETMMIEIAHHFAVDRAHLVEAYEIATQVKQLPPDVVPVIVHLLPDIAVGMNARLILFDIEYHGHRIEPHFRLGPETHRFVAPAPTDVDRRGLLTLANVDRYCEREGDRCLVYLNEVWWPDYDVQFKTL